MDLSEMADQLAKDSKQNQNPSGVYFLDDVEQIAIYDDNPMAFADAVRDQHLLDMREWLQTKGLKEKGFGRHLPEHIDPNQPASFAYALIIDAPQALLFEIRQKWKQIVGY